MAAKIPSFCPAASSVLYTAAPAASIIFFTAGSGDRRHGSIAQVDSDLGWLASRLFIPLSLCLGA